MLSLFFLLSKLHFASKLLADLCLPYNKSSNIYMFDGKSTLLD